MAPKTIFGTTEKSNFILNMPTRKLNKLILALAIICSVTPLLGGLLGLIGGSLSYYPSILLTLCGFVSVLVFIICLLKKDVIFTKNISYFIIIAFGIMAAVSAVLAFNTDISIFGNRGRYEGLLAILSYIGIFLLGTCVADKKDVKKIFSVIIVICAIQCLVGVLQSVGIIPTDFKNLSPIAIENIYLPEAFTASPIFLGTLLSLANGIVLLATCYHENQKVRIVSCVTAVLIAILTFLCESLVPVIGVGISTILVFIFVFIKEKKAEKKKDFFKKPLTKIISYAIVLAVTAGIFGLVGELCFNDEGIAWQDSFYKNFVSGQLTITQYKENDFYSHTWGNTIDFIKSYPLEGTGPDCLIYAQVTDGNIPGSTNTFDKPYNDYLYTAATRGIASLILYLALIVFSIKRMLNGIKSFKEDTSDWHKIALFISLITYLVVMFFSASSILVAPYFWLLLGISFSKKLD